MALIIEGTEDLIGKQNCFSWRVIPALFLITRLVEFYEVKNNFLLAAEEGRANSGPNSPYFFHPPGF